ncbi:hypothetical protein DN752_15340 [Echinicola strongylocentroti]|uniref:Addiction module protein n=1 Tax=Echinicola strongylocentroti TaxID=1795355 RepID=A0A2Z4ILW6_9BACT|nr:hypothetical protein [Echinicola strongylocentroti]AWW31383.1 hypothetical protein DN752_15340 [Echinicola strongylocentroti]
MTTVDQIRNGLIGKILAIEDRDLLKALDKVVSASSVQSKIELTVEQEAMLEMSERDIENNELISQEAMDKRNMEWLAER